MKIFLIGFMGSGKSAVGKLLATRLGFDFIDTDKRIEVRLGKEILTVFKTDGESTFRLAENEMIHEIIKKPGRVVIASGGGMPCSDENLKLMMFFGTTVYLKRSIDDLFDILQNEAFKRPLLANAPDLKEAITSLLEPREPCYNMAKHVVEIDRHENIEQVVERIACVIEKTTRQ
jgi:shikimate kinase